MSKGPKQNEGGGIGEGEAGIEGEENKVEEISPENMKYAEPLLPYFGEEVVKKIFSRPWAVREEGMKEAEDIIKKDGSDQPVF